MKLQEKHSIYSEEEEKSDNATASFCKADYRL